MRSLVRRIVGCSPGVIALALVTACGGGSAGGSSSSSSSAHNFSGGGSNVVTMSVGNGPATQNTFNIPYISVTVCETGTSSCVTVNKVLVDTGSSGLRLLKSQLGALTCTNGNGLCPMANPAMAGNTIAECLPFADGYAWGSVASAKVQIGGEMAPSVPVQIIDDSSSPSPALPQSCGSGQANMDLNSVTAFDANGVLGVGVFIQDCGSACVQDQAADVYYSCSAAGQCSSTTLPLSNQVSNPVANFATDNNGVILQLPAISATGAQSTTGYLVFGIGTQSNNGLQGATVLTVGGDGDFNPGDFTTTFNGNNSLSGFLDSGSNALFFPDSSLALCGTSGSAASFYCPASTVTLSANNAGMNGNTTTASFQIADLNAVSEKNFAVDDAGGPSSSVGTVGTNYFDWGLPFFYGQTVFVAIEGLSAGGTVGPYFAY